jgi:flagellar hook-basal body complex protein FliE
MITPNSNVGGILPKTNLEFPGVPKPKIDKTDGKGSDFADTIKAVGKYISKIEDLQQSADTSVKDLLVGKNEDINSVVAAVAKADMSFKLLVGVRNKLIEAYKQTMNMQI